VSLANRAIDAALGFMSSVSTDTSTLNARIITAIDLRNSQTIVRSEGESVQGKQPRRDEYDARGASRSHSQLEIRRRVTSLSQDGRHAEAKALIQQVILQRENNPLIWNDLGVECSALGQLEEAIDAFRHAIKLSSPPYPSVLFNLANTMFRQFRIDIPLSQRNTPEARRHLSEINYLLNKNLDLAPDNLQAHLLLSDVLVFLGQHDLAALHLEIVRRAEAPKS